MYKSVLSPKQEDKLFQFSDFFKKKGISYIIYSISDNGEEEELGSVDRYADAVNTCYKYADSLNSLTCARASVDEDDIEAEDLLGFVDGDIVFFTGPIGSEAREGKSRRTDSPRRTGAYKLAGKTGSSLVDTAVRKYYSSFCKSANNVAKQEIRYLVIEDARDAGVKIDKRVLAAAIQNSVDWVLESGAGEDLLSSTLLEYAKDCDSTTADELWEDIQMGETWDDLMDRAVDLILDSQELDFIRNIVTEISLTA